MADRNRKTWREEPIRAVMAFIAVAFLSLFVAVSIMVGATHIEPRAALLMALGPTALIGLLAARFRPTRLLFSKTWALSGG